MLVLDGIRNNNAPRKKITFRYQDESEATRAQQQNHGEQQLRMVRYYKRSRVKRAGRDIPRGQEVGIFVGCGTTDCD